MGVNSNTKCGRPAIRPNQKKGGNALLLLFYFNYKYKIFYYFSSSPFNFRLQLRTQEMRRSVETERGEMESTLKVKLKIESKSDYKSAFSCTNSVILHANFLWFIQKYFGYSVFRPYQKDVIQRIIEKRDCLVVMATGSGKSLW